MADEPIDDDDDDIESRFESWYQERQAADEKKRNRAKQPKDFGEYLDRVADAVLDKIEERANKRREEREQADEAPARGSGESKFSQWWGSGERSA